MRGVTILVVAGLVCASAARAQGVVDGPLAAPDAPAKAAAPTKGTKLEGAKPSVAKSKTAKPKIAHRSKATHAATKSDEAKPERAERDIPVARQAPSDDPLSLGMKWNGSNDNSAQTRSQNYNGGASGTGAEVGLKLHF